MGKTSKVEIAVGDKIGVVEVIRRVYNERRKEWEYVCRCRCGNEFRTRKDHLLKPRIGCKACVNKVKVDIDLAGTISEEEYNKVLEAKNFEKMQKKALKEKEKAERIEQIKLLRAERKRQIEEKKKKIYDSRLVSEIWIGQKFNRLTVIDTYADSGKTYWVCECECGNIVTKLAKSVKFGHFISCGCRSKEIMRNAISKERLYSIWQGMKDRCLNSNNPNYHNYGGRGIKICDEWSNSYKNFKDWAYKHEWTEEIPENHRDVLSIERINVNGNYCPENCCFIPLWKQVYNKRPYCERNKIKTRKDRNLITINSETKSEREWQKIYNISDSTLRYRLSLGMSIEEALTIDKYGVNSLYGRRKKYNINIGDKFGNVLVVDKVYNDNRKEWCYKCKCETCGSEFTTRTDHLLKPRIGCRACANRYIARTRRDRRNSDSAGSIINNI